MKQINVVAAIIEKDNCILATQRGYGKLKGFWEFPGGKIEEGESPELALHREIYEELKVEININTLFDVLDYDYPDFHLHMKCFLCTIKQGTLTLVEHDNCAWLNADNILTVNWLPADIELVQKLKSYLQSKV